VRRKSSIDREKQRDRFDRARRLTPEQRLIACMNLARTGAELQRAGMKYRENHPPISHP